MDAAKKQLITQENMLANFGEGGINADLLKLSKARIGRGKYSSPHAGHVHPSGCSESINLK